jgi:amino acid transporter
MVMGIVIGAGIFSLPPFVASNVDGPATFIGVWLIGGLVSLIGALCYAELAATYPNAGGDYHFLMRAFGAGPAFLFAWSRMTVTQTGLIALSAFVVGDYLAAAVVPATTSAATSHLISSLCAATVVIGLTAINMAGVREGAMTQKIFAVLVVLGMLLIAAAGLAVVLRGDAAAAAAAAPSPNALGTAMVFVLFTYGGWNEAAYFSAEMKGGSRSIVVALMLGLVVVTTIYILVNVSYVAALGFEEMKESKTVAADVLRAAWGTKGALLITAILLVAGLSTANATAFTGARSNYALGRDFSIFQFMGQWSERTSTPRNAFLVQGLISLALVGLGAYNRSGVRTMVDYTSPVFWLFFLLVGLSLFALRIKEPDRERPFRVPLYPLTPLVFCATSGYMLYSSLSYHKQNALVGVGVLAAGLPVMLIAFARRKRVVDGNQSGDRSPSPED